MGPEQIKNQCYIIFLQYLLRSVWRGKKLFNAKSVVDLLGKYKDIRDSDSGNLTNERNDIGENSKQLFPFLDDLAKKNDHKFRRKYFVATVDEQKTKINNPT